MYTDSERELISWELAQAFLEAPWEQVALAESGAGRLDRWPTWMTALTMTVVATHRSRPVDGGGDDALFTLIYDFLTTRERSTTRIETDADAPQLVRLASPSAAPAPRHGWPVVALDSTRTLAELLELSDGQLAWLADVRGLERSVPDERLRNYRYRMLARRSGLPRMIEMPKLRLKEIQRWILRSILDRIPPHEASHGFSRGRSVIGHARAHVGQGAVLGFDLRDFFASVTAGRAFAIFTHAGYDRAVAHALTGLCTNTVPASVWEAVRAAAGAPGLEQPRFWLGRRLATPHLPQGAPTSPALANLAAFGLDRRLAGLAQASGARYTRYADDLVFSGSLRLLRRRDRFSTLVAQIARDEGFALNAEKSSLRTSASRQQVCGIVVNARPNAPRTEYDRLRATLHNAARRGPAGENRSGRADFEAHLRGRIAWVTSLNAERGAKLRGLFDTIDWSDGEAAAE